MICFKERKISEKWVELTLTDPDRCDEPGDGTVHYMKGIKEHNNRYLRVIVNPGKKPIKIITLFFDRRLRIK